MKTISAIDIGTNSMRFLLCEVQGNSMIKKAKELIVTRIGKDLSKAGVITDESLAKNIEALKYFKNKAERFGAQEIYAIATSALREASNREVFVSEALIQAGVEVKIISGEEEAELGLRGVMSGIQNPEERVLVIDIGGGSTELILGSKKKADYSVSIPAGAVRLTEQFVSGNPISNEDIADMKKKLDTLFKKPLEYLGREKIDNVFAIGGTATTIAAIFHGLGIYEPDIVHNTVINLCSVDSIFKKLKGMSIRERWNVKGLQRERADVMPAGIYVLKHLIKGLKKDEIIISENDNLEGIIEKYVMNKPGRYGPDEQKGNR